MGSPLRPQSRLKKESPVLLLEKELGYSFGDVSLLTRALTHVSYNREKSAGHNEVLEFLGDAVLDLAISDLLIRSFPERSEGDLSRIPQCLPKKPLCSTSVSRCA